MSYEGLLQRWRIYDDINYKLSILRYYSDYTKFPVLDITQNNSNKMPMLIVYTYVYKYSVGCCLLSDLWAWGCLVDR